VHAAAWKQMFDACLEERAKQTGAEFVPFDPVHDYDEYVDGKPRYGGVQSFLAARGIALPRGEPSDAPSAETVDGLGNRKNEIVLRLIREQRVEPYEGSVRCVEAARDAGLRRAVVSSSTNCRDVLVAADIEDLFEASIDGVAAGKGGGFGFAVGVDRVGQAAALREHGANVVVTDLGELLAEP
jgi:beta-phosphoglucomutase-like phosphatase (HAD superfamily)